jgi:uncharacterized protein (DUF924 family)
MMDIKPTNRVIETDNEYVAVAHIIEVSKSTYVSYRYIYRPAKFLWFTYDEEISEQCGYHFYIYHAKATRRVSAPTQEEAETKKAEILRLIEELKYTNRRA